MGFIPYKLYRRSESVLPIARLTMQVLRVPDPVFGARIVNAQDDGGVMGTSDFVDRAPDVAQLTAYDESHLAAYLRLLDADEEGADWRETAAVVLGVDAAAEPQRAKTMHDSHLARARWMTEVGYAHLLGCERPLKH